MRNRRRRGLIAWWAPGTKKMCRVRGLEQLDRTGVDVVLSDGIGAPWRGLRDLRAVSSVGPRIARQPVGTTAQTLVGVRNELRSHVLELQRGHRTAEGLQRL